MFIVALIFCPLLFLLLYAMKLSTLSNTDRLEQGVLRVAGLAVWVGILPFFLLCWYAHPSADDFLQANDVSKHGHWGYLSYMYLQWSGRYTAMLGWSFLNPVSYGYDKSGYGLVCFLLLVLLLASLTFLLRTLVQGAGLTSRQLWQAGAGALLLFVYQLPSTAECFYWLTSGFNYLLPGILLLLSLAVLAKQAQTTKPTRQRHYYLVLLSVLLFLMVGCNESIAVPTLLTTWVLVLLESRRQRRLVGLGVALAVSAGCALAFLAPGNTVRMEMLEQDRAFPSLPLTVVRVIKFTSYCLVNWLGNGILLAVTLLLVPLFARFARLPELPINQLVRYPLLLTLLIPGFLAAGVLPAFSVTGNPSPPRAQDMLYLCLLANWLLAAYAWVYYFINKRHINAASFQLPAFAWWSLLAWLPLTFLTDYNHHLWDNGYRLSTNNSLLAYRDLLHGRAARYDAQLTARYHYLRNSWTPHAKVVPLIDPPVTLYFTDISPDPNNWDNRAYADFFDKESIVVEADK